MGKNNSSFGKGWDGGPGRAGSKRSLTGTGAPVTTPCSPRASRFRRARPLSCTPYRAGAADTATVAAPAASVAAMATAGSHATVRLPALPAPPAGKPPPQLPPPSRFSAPMRTARTHARTHNLHPTAQWGRLPRRLRTHRSRRPCSSMRRRSGCCLPTAAPAPRMRTRTLDRPSTRLRRLGLQSSDVETGDEPSDNDGSASVDMQANHPPLYAPFTPLDEKAREPEVCRTSSRLRAIVCRSQCWSRLMTDVSALSAAQGGSSLRVRVGRGR